MSQRPVTFRRVERVSRPQRERTNDLVAVEEPLQIVLEHGEGHARRESPLALTMRTPGHDRDLVVGFLFAEGVISSTRDLIRVRHCAQSDTPHNVVRAVLAEHVSVPRRLLERRLAVTTACGVCGGRTVEALSTAGCRPLPHGPGRYQPEAVRGAIESLERSQDWFRHTGGTHGAAVFEGNGELLHHREDVGRHNALDKLVGAWVADPSKKASSPFVVVSSRASFELVYKAIRAEIPMLVAIGAPTSLAIDTAKHFGLTLIGFAKGSRFNVYAGHERLGGETSSQLAGVGAAR